MSWCRLGVSCAVSGSVGPAPCSQPTLPESCLSSTKAVQKMLGHASAAMTLDVYADLFSDDSDAVATALDLARSRQNVGTGPAKPDGSTECATQPQSPNHASGLLV